MISTPKQQQFSILLHYLEAKCLFSKIVVGYQGISSHISEERASLFFAFLLNIGNLALYFALCAKIKKVFHFFFSRQGLAATTPFYQITYFSKTACVRFIYFTSLTTTNISYLISNIDINIFTECITFWKSCSTVFYQIKCFQWSKWSQQLLYLKQKKFHSKPEWYLWLFNLNIHDTKGRHYENREATYRSNFRIQLTIY